MAENMSVLKAGLLTRGDDEKRRNKYIADLAMKYLEKNITNEKEVKTNLAIDTVNFSRVSTLNISYNIKISEEQSRHLCLEYLETYIGVEMKSRYGINIIKTKTGLRIFYEEGNAYLHIEMSVILGNIED